MCDVVDPLPPPHWRRSPHLCREEHAVRKFGLNLKIPESGETVTPLKHLSQVLTIINLWSMTKNARKRAMRSGAEKVMAIRCGRGL